MTPDTKLLLVGCGKMGSALLQRMADKVQAYIVEPSEAPAIFEKANIVWLSTPDKISPAFQPDIIILAIKPQSMACALPAYARYKNCVFLSIAAGITTAHLENSLGKDNHAIVRCMPNLPASIGQGMSVAVANKNVTLKQRNLCDEFIRAVGETAWVEDESLIDAVTALSGSGPAYVFALCEAMAKAGEVLGLNPEMAARLARQTLVGSGALLAQSTESVEALRAAVTSPKGTTEAALSELMALNGLPELMQKTMTAALRRAQELAKSA